MKILSRETTVLGQDPDRVHRINANSFQQNAITTVKGWQYAAFYSQNIKSEGGTACYVNLARRQVSAQDETLSSWQIVQFHDHLQTVDDGHNTISIGVCAGDDTIHIAFDHHCSPLEFRMSKVGDVRGASSDEWKPSRFNATQNSLPGCGVLSVMKEVTYPRFLNIGDDLLLTHRIGQAGLGSDVMYRYSSKTHEYTYLSEYLTGVSNSPYINGIDFRLNRLHISWCYRNFMTMPESAGVDAHKQQAGPNGPENNFDLNYAFSDDLGETWKNSTGNLVAQLQPQDQNALTSIKPDSEGVQAFEIPMESGILNQEGQTADGIGGFWVLNREKVAGEERWMVYHRDPEGEWCKIVIDCTSTTTETGSRGSICADRESNIYAIIPGNTDSSLNVLLAQREDDYGKFESIWREDGFDGEPLVDVQRLEMSNVLSVFTRTGIKDGKRNVVVVDLLLG